MVLLNLKRVLFLVAFSQSVLSGVIKSSCGEVPDDAKEEVNEVSEKLNISYCDAANVYNYIMKGEKLFEDIPKNSSFFSEQICKNKCSNAAKKLDKEFNIENLDKIKEYCNILLDIDFLTNCEEMCHLAFSDAKLLKMEKIINTTNFETNSEFEKRDTKQCDPVSQGIIHRSPTSPYRYGFYRYTQGTNSAQTAISVVNGCGPKNNAQVSEIVGSLPYAEDFRPACNSHDICVTCHQLPRSGCDSQFKTNLKSLCSMMYEIYSGDSFFVKAKKKAQKVDCDLTASLFADAVSLFGEKAYQDTPVNTSTDCAACGVPIVRDTLYKTPFYVLK